MMLVERLIWPDLICVQHVSQMETLWMKGQKVKGCNGHRVDNLSQTGHCNISSQIN